MARYFLSPDLVIRDYTEGKLHDRSSGEQYKVTAETLALLRQFTRPRELDDVLDSISTSPTESKRIRTFLATLLKQRLLRSNDHKVSSQDPTPLADRAIVEFPSHTFFCAPARELQRLESGVIAFMGVPFDLGTTGYPGSRFAPERLRYYCATQFEYADDLKTGGTLGWHFDGFQSRILTGLKLRDVGNVICEVGEPLEFVHRRVGCGVNSILQAGGFPLVIGGDHSITYGIAKAGAQFHGKMGLIHVDAHTDISEVREGCCHHHGNYVTRLLKDQIVDRVWQFGMRGNCGALLSSRKYKLASGKLGPHQIPKSKGAKPLCHLSIDVDVLDPAFAPGTGTPVANGSSLDQLVAFLNRCCSEFNIVSFDLVEINPMRDINDLTLATGSEVVLRFLRARFDKRRR